MKNILIAITILFSAFVFIQCTEDEVTSTENGTLKLEFDNVVGTSNLQLNTSNFAFENALGEDFKVTWLSYYISEVRLKKEDGTYFVDPVAFDGSKGFYLIDEADAESHVIELKDVPPGSYTEVTFKIGVDASQMTQGAQTGPLDPSIGLFWSWNSGYIFFAMEGASPVSTAEGNALVYHVGGYKTLDGSPNLVNNIKEITLTFNGDNPIVDADEDPQVHIIMDLKKFFNGPAGNISFASNSVRHSPASCVDVAQNMAAAFNVDHIHQ
ncbi:MAG: hypothetical protein O9302_12980 [Cyclobacteriaceae bacterium]|jgi:hypothetical protein|nr:hypothetical protein [Cytophagales bacterium]MCZ8328973.1 hypothetical protein [Cyclobacteriaceae bacterium]